MKFEINESSLEQISVTKTWSKYAGRTDLTHDELIKVIKGEDKIGMTSSEDHPDFAELREMLGNQGYIRIQRSWWNGDEVTKEFYLNGKRFREGDQFPSAGAMKYHLKHMMEDDPDKRTGAASKTA